MRPTRKLGASIALAAALSLIAAVTALGHVHVQAGSYDIALGWATEPTYAAAMGSSDSGWPRYLRATSWSASRSAALSEEQPASPSVV